MVSKIKIKSKQRKLQKGEIITVKGKKYMITSVNQRDRYWAKPVD